MNSPIIICTFSGLDSQLFAVSETFIAALILPISLTSEAAFKVNNKPTYLVQPKK